MRVTPREPIRILTVRQPWASLLALRVKKDEVRSWPTTYRGLVALHVGVNFPAYERSVCSREPVAAALKAAGLFDPAANAPRGKPDFSRLPIGGIFAAARIVGCVVAMDNPKTALLERALGESLVGQYAFLLEDVTPLSTLIPCNGALGLLKLDPKLRPRLLRQLRSF